MNGYCKINSSGNTHKLRSKDFPDLFSSIPETIKTTRTTKEEGDEIDEEKVKKSTPKKEDDDVEAVGKVFGVVLGRSASVSSSSSSSSGLGFQGTMKRALSMRRSSSVSERYCRIHDQYMALAPSIGEEVDEEMKVNKKKKKKSKILRACKRLLGF